MIVYAGALIFLGYEGFELIANAAEDARDPRRNLPLAYGISIGVVIALICPCCVCRRRKSRCRTDRPRPRLRAGRGRASVPGISGVHLDRDRRCHLHRERDQCDPLRHRKFTYLMARHGELPAALGQPVWDRPIGGLLATTVGTLVVVNAVDIEGISLMGSAGFLLIFAAVNVAVRGYVRAGRPSCLRSSALWPAWDRSVR